MAGGRGRRSHAGDDVAKKRNFVAKEERQSMCTSPRTRLWGMDDVALHFGSESMSIMTLASLDRDLGEFTPSYILHTCAFGTYLLGGLFTLQQRF